MEAATSLEARLEARVIEALIELGPEPEQVTPDATLESLDIDSLDLVEISQILDQEFEIKLQPEDFENVTTVGEAMTVILGYVR